MQGRKATLRVVEGGLNDCPPPPSWLHFHAANEWRRVVPGLIERRVLAAGDMATVENYCVAIGIVRQCEAVLQDEGLFVHSDRSNTCRPHPAFRLQAGAMGSANRLAQELGLTPAARNKPVSVGAADDEEGWEDGLLA